MKINKKRINKDFREQESAHIGKFACSRHMRSKLLILIFGILLIAPLVSALCLNPLELFCIFGTDSDGANVSMENVSMENITLIDYQTNQTDLSDNLLEQGGYSSPESYREESEINLTHINYQTDETDLGNNHFKQESYLGFENYKDGNEFKKINMTLIDHGNYWKTTRSIYHPTIPKYSDEWFEFNNVLEGNNHSIKMRPLTNHIKGELNISENKVVYKDAFSDGIDLEVYPFNDNLLKKVVINKPQNEDLYFDFELSFDRKLTYSSTDKDNVKSSISLKSLELSSSLREKGIEFNEGRSPTIIYPMKVWDSNNSVEYIDSKIYEKDGKLYLRKIISKEFLDKAVYPVYTDSDTGVKSAGTTLNVAGVGTRAWSTPQYATVSDNVYAYAVFSGTGETSNYLQARNFGFSIPSGNKIDGIVVEIERMTQGSYVTDDSVKIGRPDGTMGATNKAGGSWPYNSNDYASYGSSTDLWGETWATTDMADTDFGVWLVAYGTIIGYVDHIRMTVYYSAVCYSYNPTTKILYVPKGCTYYIPKGTTVYG